MEFGFLAPHHLDAEIVAAELVPVRRHPAENFDQLLRREVFHASRRMREEHSRLPEHRHHLQPQRLFVAFERPCDASEHLAIGTDLADAAT